MLGNKLERSTRALPLELTDLLGNYTLNSANGRRTTICSAAPWSARVFAGLEGAPALLLAASGGPDSMALLHLAASWGRALGRAAPTLYVATIDHGLRPESAAEAALVAAVAAKLGHPHATLAWVGEKPTTRIQERARAARYALLVEHAEKIGATHVLTAHHADDQAETVLMRLGRGSGIGGLAGMRRETALASVMLVRPLLDIPKADLIALCETENLAYVDDPSNRDPAYARARLRRDTAAFARLGLDRATLLRLARRAARAEDALEAEAARVEALIAASGKGAMSLVGHRGMEPEILLRVLRRLIQSAAPSGRPLRLERLERLAAALGAALRDGRSHRATLGSARVVLDTDATLAVAPSPLRRRGARQT